MFKSGEAGGYLMDYRAMLKGGVEELVERKRHLEADMVKKARMLKKCREDYAYIVNEIVRMVELGFELGILENADEEMKEQGAWMCQMRHELEEAVKRETSKPKTFESRSGFEKAVEQVKGCIRDHAEVEARFPRYFGIVLDGYNDNVMKKQNLNSSYDSKIGRRGRRWYLAAEKQDTRRSILVVTVPFRKAWTFT